ncbi:MAG: chaperone modulator CbpM [Chromatiales bacterium]
MTDNMLTLAELSRCSGASAEKLLLLVSEGLLSPCGRSQHEWLFDYADLQRALQALHLERDLGINPAGAALAIELLDEMQHMRQRLRLLEALVFRQ